MSKTIAIYLANDLIQLSFSLILFNIQTKSSSYDISKRRVAKLWSNLSLFCIRLLKKLHKYFLKTVTGVNFLRVAIGKRQTFTEICHLYPTSKPSKQKTF